MCQFFCSMIVDYHSLQILDQSIPVLSYYFGKSFLVPFKETTIVLGTVVRHRVPLSGKDLKPPYP